MYKTILTVIASLAVLALGVSIVSAVLQHSSITHQAKQVAALRAAQNLDSKEIRQLEGRLRRRHASTTNAARIPVILLVVHAGRLSTAASSFTHTSQSARRHAR